MPLFGRLALGLVAITVALSAAGYLAACSFAFVRVANTNNAPVAADVPVPGETVPGLSRLPQAQTPTAEATKSLTLTVTLKRTHQTAFRQFLAAVQNARSPLYHHYLTQAQLAARFGPTPQAYGAVQRWLRSNGFALVQDTVNRMSLSARGTRADVERALHTPIENFQMDKRVAYANVENPTLPASVAPDVQSISGLSNLSVPSAPQDEYLESLEKTNPCLGKALKIAVDYLFDKAALAVFLFAIPEAIAFAATLEALDFFISAGEGSYNVLEWANCLRDYGSSHGGAGAGAGGASSPSVSSDVPPPKGKSGTAIFSKHTVKPSTSGHAKPAAKLGLLEFDTYRPTDVADWVNLTSSNTAALSTLSEVPVNGGVSSPGAGESEVLLDIDTALDLASNESPPQIVVYDAPPSTSFVQMFETMIEDKDTVISNSWSQCENGTSEAEAVAINEVLANAAASGISVFNGSGDDGSTCLDGSPNTVGVPADSPNATSVGGTTPSWGEALNVTSERWWNGTDETPPSGEGGFGVSKYFARPSYQNGLSAAAGRSVPDVALDANPQDGIELCQADAGGCPDNRDFGGTSMTAPELAIETAQLDQSLGYNIGNFNDAIYPIAGDPDAFTTASSMGSDFAHVGLGAPNMEHIYEALKGLTPGPTSPSASNVSTGPAPADGSSDGLVRVQLLDENGLPEPGKTVTVTSSSPTIEFTSDTAVSDAEGVATFIATNTNAEAATITAEDTSDHLVLAEQPTLKFVPPAATGATIAANPTIVTDDGSSQATIQVYLQNGLGRPAEDKTVKLTGGGSAVINPVSDEAVTNSEGVATFTTTDTAKESIGFTAVDVTDAELPVPGSAVVNFQPEGAAGCEDTPPSPTTDSPVAVSPFASEFPDNTQGFEAVYEGITFKGGRCSGINAPTFDGSGNVFVPDETNGQIYEFGSGGGTADTSTALANDVPGLNAIAFGKKGELYATLNAGGNLNQPELAELNPSNGAIERVIATKATGMYDFPTYMAVDPISGDVFIVDDGAGGNPPTEHFSVTRVSNPDSSSPTVSDYGNVEGVQTGITFAPDGTMYVGVVSGPYENYVLAVSATNSPSPGTVTPVIKVPAGALFGVAVAEADEQGHATALDLINDEGDIYKVNVTVNPATAEEIAERPAIFTRGGAIGPDGCLYYQDQDMLLKITGVSSRCAGAQGGNAGPQIALTDGGPANPPTGSQTTVTAALTNFPDVEGTDVTFEVAGANGQVKLVHANASAEASFSYSGVFPGVDTIKALARSGEQEIESAPVSVHWTAGKETTFLSLNASQESGPLEAPATLTANLSDVSQEPATPIAGASVTIQLTGQSCAAVTNAQGNASCSISPAGALGLDAVTAAYGGSETYTASNASNTFEAGGVGLAPAPGEPPMGISPSPKATPTPTPTPHGSTLPAKVATPALASVLGLPPASMCVSKRKLVVHVHAPTGQKLLSVTLTLGHKLLRSVRFVKGKDHKIPSTVVNLQGLPKGTFTLEIVVRTKSGKAYRARRTYHTCVAGKKPAHK